MELTLQAALLFSICNDCVLLVRSSRVEMLCIARNIARVYTQFYLSASSELAAQALIVETYWLADIARMV